MTDNPGSREQKSATDGADYQEELRTWVREVRRKFRIGGTHRQTQEFWRGYEAAVDDVERKINTILVRDAYELVPVRNKPRRARPLGLPVKWL